MAHNVLVNLQLAGNQILGLRLEVLAVDPSGADLYEGRLWFNSTDDLVKYYDGTSVIPWGTGGVATLTVDNTTIEDIGTATDPSIRVKAGGITNAHVTGPIDFSKIGPPAADFDVNTHKIINLTDPTAPQDAATKAYVDAFVAGLAYKEAVRVATTAAGTLATGFENGDTVDGVVLVTGNRILIKNQAAPAENGIYTVNNSGAPTRALDADSASDLTGAAVFVNEGTTQGNTLWVMTTDDPIVVNTTGLVFAQFGGPGSYSAGTGLTLTGTIFSLTIPVAVSSGGTGGTTAAAAKTNLGFKTGFAVDSTAGATTTVTHNLNTLDVLCQVWEIATGALVLADVIKTSVNALTVTFTPISTAAQYRIVVFG